MRNARRSLSPAWPALWLIALALGLGDLAAGQDAPAPPKQTEAQVASAQEAFASIQAALQEVRKSPPADRRALVQALYRQCGEFLDEHLRVATTEQLELAAGIWLEVADQNGDSAAIGRRLPELKRAKGYGGKLTELVERIEAKANVKKGAPAPEWSGVDVKDPSKTLSLTSLRGKLVLVDFWASWCGPCKALMSRRLAPLHQRYKDDDRFVLVSVGLPWNGDTAQKQADTARQLGTHWRKVFDASGKGGTRYAIEGIPFLCLVDTDGNILTVGSGWQVIDEVEQLLAARLDNEREN